MRTTPFSKSRLGLFTASALAGLVATAGADTTLRWKFQKGETLNYTMVQKTLIKVSANGQNIENTINQTIDTTWEVKDAKPDGTAEVVQSFDRIRMTMDSPGMKVEYDSKDGKLPEGPIGQLLGPLLKALAGAQITLKMNGRGEVTDVKIPEQVLAAMPGGAAGGGMFTEDGLKKTIMQSTLTLPQEAVSRGKNWHQKSEIQTPGAGMTMVIDNAYTYQGTDTQAGGKVDRIDVAVNTDIKNAEGSPYQFKVKSQESKGTCLFDNEKGRLDESTVSQKLELVVTVMGKEILQSQETTSSMKLNKAS